MFIQLEFIRDSVIIALRPNLKREKQYLDFHSAIDKRTMEYHTHPQKSISMGDYSITINAEPIRTLNYKPFIRTNIPIAPIEYKNLVWLRSIRKLPTLEKMWINYCYGDEHCFNDLTKICLYLYNTLLTHSNLPKLNKNSKKIVTKLVLLSIQDYKETLFKGKSRYNSATLAKLTGKSPASWNLSYKPRWELLLNILKQLDSRSLRNVYSGTVYEIKERHSRMSMSQSNEARSYIS